jgi:hypothetical protein
LWGLSQHARIAASSGIASVRNSSSTQAGRNTAAAAAAALLLLLLQVLTSGCSPTQF